jgi:hypothetical protein
MAKTRALFIALPLLLVATACATLLGLDRDLPSARSDAATLDASVGDTGGNDSSVPCSSDAGTVADEMNAVFVSAANGMDSADGSKAHPVRSISQALELARQRTLGVLINVCAGTYAEALTIETAGLSLRGGYDCTTWMRGPGFGKCGGWQNNGATIIGPAADAGAPKGAIEIGTATTLEGVEIHGVAGPAISTRGSNVKIYESRVEGAVMNTLGPSRGVVVTDGNVEISRSTVHGGAGVMVRETPGSVSIESNEQRTAAVVVRDSELHAGNGWCQNPCGNAAVAYGATVGAGTLAMFNSVVFGDRPAQPLPANTNAFVGVSVGADATARLEDTRVETRSRAPNELGPTINTGFNVNGTLTMVRSRIDLGGLGVNSGSQCSGVNGGATATLELRDNAILPSCKDANTQAYGVRLDGLTIGLNFV